MRSLYVLIFIGLCLSLRGHVSEGNVRTGDSTDLLFKAQMYLASNVDSASKYANEILASGSSDVELSASALQILAEVSTIKGEWNTALNRYYSAIDLWRSNNSLHKIGHAYLGIGNIYLREGELFELNGNFTEADIRYERAHDFYLKSLTYLEKSKEDIAKAKAYSNIGMSAFRLYQEQEALKYLKKARSLLHDKNGEELLSAVNSNLGIVYETVGHLDSAQFFYTAARNYFKRTGALENWASANINLATVKESTDRDLAIQLLAEADSISIINRNLERRSLIHSLLSRLYRNKHDYERALVNYVQYVKFKDSVLSKDYKTEELNIRYQTARNKELIQRQKAENLEQQIAINEARDQSKMFAIIFVSVAMVLAVSTLIIVARYHLKNTIASQQIELQKERLERLEGTRRFEAAKALLAGQEKERMRVSEDLHDRLGSTLVAAKMQLEIRSNGNNSSLEKAQALVMKAINDVREISKNLISGVLVNLGLLAAIRELIDGIEASGSISVRLDVIGDIHVIEQKTEIGIFRIIQELTSNTLKHADASIMRIKLKLVNDQFTLCYQDNGRGFKVDEVIEGLGLKNIERRVGLLNGRMHVRSSPNEGSLFLIKARLSDERMQVAIS